MKSLMSEKKRVTSELPETTAKTAYQVAYYRYSLYNA